MSLIQGIIKLKWPLSLERTLLGGQSFRFVKNENEDHYIGVYANILWKMKTKEKELHFEVIGELKAPNTNKSTYYKTLLTNYFRLNEDLNGDYEKWKKAHEHFDSKKVTDVALVTQLDQEVVETVFSFICSQNNNIKRISSLVEKLCVNFGEKICKFEDKDYYSFPTLEALSKESVETKLRELGFGYRSKYIQKAAEEIISKGGVEWLEKLKLMKYEDAHSELLKLSGIGPKVADCICLMCLNFLQAVPVDTHVKKIALHYVPELKNFKSMNMTMYRKIGNTFRQIYGDKSGVAQTVLFCKELTIFENEEKVIKKKPKKS
ncbi:hypothetical protein PVAND_009567 [Polypedilum vanderplanki]|uniref:N-glycosylase/DNA lyase n=1 Tax=Polypedilum vanderplanki TaxID=319348 RepID=A0A9J6CD56_POLVA|nr:hypothetical protein PVAND_009567 [Polypedilum vanderplanki]